VPANYPDSSIAQPCNSAKTLLVFHPAVGVKICGLTRVEDAVACAAASVDWVGLNFHPGSPRYVEPERAAEIIAALPSSITPVGVFVDRPATEVADLSQQHGLRLVQLHGRESPEYLFSLRQLKVIRAFRLGGISAWDGVREYLARAELLGCPPHAILIDSYVAGQPGGTGVTVGGDILDSMPPLPRLLLAGGLSPANVAARVRQFRPWMVDVATGVESAPGRKDPALIAAFVREAKSALFAVGGSPEVGSESERIARSR
jgi:phosphoribosylanthranilate isomerase